MKFQAVLVFFAGALALAAPIEERALPVVGTLGVSHCTNGHNTSSRLESVKINGLLY